MIIGFEPFSFDRPRQPPLPLLIPTHQLAIFPN